METVKYKFPLSSAISSKEVCGGAQLESTENLLHSLALKAAEQPALQNKGNEEAFNETEFKWFARNSYNIAVKHYGDWRYEETVRLLEACLSVCAFNEI